MTDGAKAMDASLVAFRILADSTPRAPSLRNDAEALALALTLAITAPDDRTATDCAAYAEQIASRLDSATVERCKRQVAHNAAP